MAACGAGFLWGTGALIVNVLMVRHGFTPENISFWRFLVGGMVLLAGTCMALYVLCWFLGIERIGAAIPTLIALCLPPVLVALLLGETLAPLQWLGGALLIGSIWVLGQRGTAAHG